LIFVLTFSAAADKDTALRAYEQRDFATALKEWRALADRGDAEAEFWLGVMYEHGEGVAEQPMEAMNWYRKSAEQAYARAQYALGMIYAEGRGVLQHYIEAHMWLNLASANGEVDAPKQRDKLAEKMSPTQIAEAQRLAREWVPMPARVGNGVSAPVVVYKVDPNYSEEARRAKLDGTVTLQLVVDPTGRPRDIRVIHSLGLGLDEKAVEAVNQWKFQPGYRDGHPVAVRATIQVNFHLLKKPKKR
jgi:TonB family protein